MAWQCVEEQRDLARVRQYERGRLVADSVRAHARQSASEGECWPEYRRRLGHLSATSRRLSGPPLGDISANLGDPLACRGLSDQKGGGGGGGGEDGGGGDAAG